MPVPVRRVAAADSAVPSRWRWAADGVVGCGVVVAGSGEGPRRAPGRDPGEAGSRAGVRVIGGGGGGPATARARSRTTAAAAAARAAARAMRVICQPGMPTVITRTVPPGAAGTGPYAPPGSGIRMVAAEAAGTAAAQASTPPVTAARTAAIRRSRAGAQPDYPAGRGYEHDRLLLSRFWPGVPASPAGSPPGRWRGSGLITPFCAAAAAGVGLPT